MRHWIALLQKYFQHISGKLLLRAALIDLFSFKLFDFSPIYLVFRATGVAISMVAARLGGIIGNVVIATLLDSYCPAPTFIVAVLLASGGLLSLMLPNTTRTALS